MLNTSLPQLKNLIRQIKQTQLQNKNQGIAISSLTKELYNTLSTEVQNIVSSENAEAKKTCCILLLAGYGVSEENNAIEDKNCFTALLNYFVAYCFEAYTAAKNNLTKIEASNKRKDAPDSPPQKNFGR